MRPPLTLDDWQKEVLKAKGNVLLCTGRQVGKTTIFAMKAAKRMLENPNQTIITISLTEDQAKLIIVMVLAYLERTEPKAIMKGKWKPTQNRVVLRNGSRIIARPVGTTGDAVRGFTGNVIYIDEAARMSKLVWEAGLPTLLTTAGDIWMSSTPFGKQGYFWDAYQNKDDLYKVFHISSERVIQERPISTTWTEEQREKALKFLESQKLQMSELQYGQEYLGLFMDDIMRFFDDNLIAKACTEKRRPQQLKNRRYFMGCDLARMGKDESTFEIVDKISPTNIIHVENQVTKKTLTNQTEDRIKQLNRQFDEIKKIYIDAGSGTLGVSIYDHLLADPETRRKVEAINNRTRPMTRDGKKEQRLLKEDLYWNLRNLMERGHIKLLDDESVQLSLRSVQYEIIRKNAGLSQLRIYGDYTHIAEGLIRAAWCTKEKDSYIWIHSIKV